MGEPSHNTLPRMLQDSLTLQFKRQFPQAIIDSIAPGQVAALTIHGVGADAKSAMESSLSEFNSMKRDGQSVRTLLNDVSADLADPGMGRERHDSLLNLLDLADNAINNGVLTGVINPLIVPSLTREVEELRRRIDTRLNMMAQEMQEREKAKKRASQKFTHVVHRAPDNRPPAALTWSQIMGRLKE